MGQRDWDAGGPWSPGGGASGDGPAWGHGGGWLGASFVPKTQLPKKLLREAFPDASGQGLTAALSPVWSPRPAIAGHRLHLYRCILDAQRAPPTNGEGPAWVETHHITT